MVSRRTRTRADGLAVAAAVAVVTTVVASRPAGAVPPRVVEARPGHGEAFVDPALDELRVTFNQDMFPFGFSWVGAGELAPVPAGAPRWLDKRTCVFPVKLEPDHEYRLSINGPRHQNFKSLEGEPAAVHQLWFRTGSADADARRRAAAAAAVPEARQRAAYEGLCAAIGGRYAYRDRLGLDWEHTLAGNAPRLVGAATAREFAARAANMLAVAEDLHLSVAAGDLVFPTYVVDPHRNYNLRVIGGQLRDFKQRSPEVFSGRVDDRIGYVCIATWLRGRAAAIEPAFAALEEMQDLDGLIVDIRPNGGGDETIAQRFAGCFIDLPIAYAKNMNVDPEQPGAMLGPFERTMQPNPAGPRFRGRVIVLMGPANISSAEQFLLMMKQVPGCTLVGMTTGGSSGNPKPVALPNGVTVMLPSWRGMTLDGTLIEGRGLDPDIEVPTTDDDVRQADPAYERAVEELRRRLEAE